MNCKILARRILVITAPVLTLFTLLLFINGCGLINQIMNPEENATTPIFAGMESREIGFLRSDGSTLILNVKIADTQAEQTAGFQFVGPAVINRSLILFVFSGPIRGMFHMQNVKAPLDIAFIASDGTLLDILAMQPGSDLYGIEDPFQFALETRAGFFEEHQIRAGDAKLVISTLFAK